MSPSVGAWRTQKWSRNGDSEAPRIALSGQNLESKGVRGGGGGLWMDVGGR